LGVLARALIDLGDHASVEWGSYFLQLALLDPLAIDEKTLGADGRHGHLGHGCGFDLRRMWTERIIGFSRATISTFER